MSKTRPLEPTRRSNRIPKGEGPTYVEEEDKDATSNKKVEIKKGKLRKEQDPDYREEDKDKDAINNNTIEIKKGKLRKEQDPDSGEEVKEAIEKTQEEITQEKIRERNRNKKFPSRQRYSCIASDSCPISLTTLSNLRRHVMIQHKWGQDKVDAALKKRLVCKLEKECPHCGSKLSNSSNLSRHLQRFCPKIFTDKPHKCHRCNSQFDYAAELTEHKMSVHTTFWCPYCSKSYVDADKLRLHVYHHVVPK